MGYVSLIILGWFCWMSTVLVNEKKERQRQKCANCHREEHANLRAGSSDG
jgi:hypothetical protein